MERTPRQRYPAQIGFDHADRRLAGEPPPQPFGKRGIELDGNDSRAGPGKGRGQRAESGAKVEDQVACTGTAGPYELVDQLAVSQEVSTGRILRRSRSPVRPP